MEAFLYECVRILVPVLELELPELSELLELLASNRTLRTVSKLSMRKDSYFRLASIRSSMTFLLHLL